MEKDTINLLKECNKGVKMGIESIDDVLNYIKSDALKKYLIDCKHEHIKLEDYLRIVLNRYNKEDEDPNPMITAMSKMKTKCKIKMHHTDATIASLMTDGCNMGIKSLNKYLNEYSSADEKAKEIAMRLIKLEERLAVDIRQFL